jgi:hypothetical protein
MEQWLRLRKSTNLSKIVLTAVLVHMGVQKVPGV